MSLGIVIANIAGPVRQSQAVPPAAVAEDPAAASVNVKAAASAPAITSQPQPASNFTVVVLQLLNEHGIVTATIPSAQQLAAYRAGTATPPG